VSVVGAGFGLSACIGGGVTFGSGSTIAGGAVRRLALGGASANVANIGSAAVGLLVSA
jgi:hypothetical protein